MRQRHDDRLHDLITRLTRQRVDDPGVAVSVIRGGDVAALRYVGLANLESQDPIGPETRFHIVSVSKTFVAATVLILAARGALKLDDEIRRYLPEVSAPMPVTVRHLLSMTSGLRDVLEIERLRGVWTSSASRRRELLDLACRQTMMSAPPGAQYMYANVNVLLLDELIARVSGMSADAFRRVTLYEPLGLTATMARPHEGVVVSDLAEPYVRNTRSGWSRATHLLGIAADPLTTNLGDLTRWLLALRAGAIAGVSVTTAMAERTRLRDGTRIYYGLGLAVRRYRGLTVLCHTGSQPGWKAHIAYIPARDVGVVILSNREDTHPAALAATLMSAIAGNEFPEPDPAGDPGRGSKAPAFAPQQISAVEGSYIEPGTGEWMTLTIKDDILCAETLGDPMFLYREGGGFFRDGDDYRATVPAKLRFAFGSSPDDITCQLNLGGQRMALRKCSAPSYTRRELSAFTGRYQNQEMASQHMIRVQDGQLSIEYAPGHANALRFVMTPIAPDIFLVRPTAPGVAHRHVFQFERNSEGIVVSVVVTMERLKGVRLLRATRGSRACS